MSEILRLDEVAKRLGVSDQTIRRWLNRGFGPPCRISPTGLYLFDAEEVAQWWAKLPAPPKVTGTRNAS
jgi:excisionase family DNA binding protein